MATSSFDKEFKIIPKDFEKLEELFQKETPDLIIKNSKLVEVEKCDKLKKVLLNG